MCNRMPPQSMRLELETAEILCKMRVCVLETRSTPNRKHVNNQAYAEYNTSSKVGIPMLRSQMNGIINVSHGHQSYTVDPCRQNAT
jgi:hypothetical protein